MSRTMKSKDRASAAHLNAAPKRGPGAARVTRKQELIRLLGQQAGADIATLIARFGWQRHTARAALSGLRKAGFEVTKIAESDGKPTRYRIAAEPPSPRDPEPKREKATDAR